MGRPVKREYIIYVRGERVRALRLARGMTQIDLSQLAGVGVSAISRVEANQLNVSAAHLRNLSRALGTTMEYLLGGDPESGLPKERVVDIIIPVENRAAGDPQANVNWEQPLVDEPPVRFTGQLRAARICGDSMAPLAYDGQYVVYSLTEPVKDGDLVIASCPSTRAQIFKRYRKPREGWAILESIRWDMPAMLYEDASLEGRMFKVIGVRF
jgi:transcriptional regulator with XRE-family HTH domain